MANQKRHWPLLVSLLALSLALAACGDDKKTTETGSGAATTTTASASTAKYCKLALELDTDQGPDIDFQSLSPEQRKDEAKKYASSFFKPKAHEIQPLAPPEIKSDIDILVATVDKVAETGDFSLFDSDPATKAADKKVHAYEETACGYAVQKVTGAEYAFTGINATAKPGPTSFNFTNGGKEMHEMMILKKKDGVTESFDDIVKLSEEEGKKKVDRVGSIDPQKPGDTNYAVVKLEKGEYLVACFLPKGSTPELFAKVDSGEAQPPDGPPHAALGMRVAITVA